MLLKSGKTPSNPGQPVNPGQPIKSGPADLLDVIRQLVLIV